MVAGTVKNNKDFEQMKIDTALLKNNITHMNNRLSEGFSKIDKMETLIRSFIDTVNKEFAKESEIVCLKADIKKIKEKQDKTNITLAKIGGGLLVIQTVIPYAIKYFINN